MKRERSKWKPHKDLSIREQYRVLCLKLRGHYPYYGIRGNYKMKEVYFEYTPRAWRHWLARRSRSDRLPWETFATTYGRWFPLPLPRIIHDV